jgi:hypothetical protein
VALDTLVNTIMKCKFKDEMILEIMFTKEMADVLQNRNMGLSQIDVVSIIGSNGVNLNF